MDYITIITIVFIAPLLWIAPRSGSKRDMRHNLYIALMHDGCEHCGGDFNVISTANDTIALRCKGCDLGYVVNPELQYAIMDQRAKQR